MMEETPKGVCIRIAGNTWVPALLALRAKGYRLWLDYNEISGSDPVNPDYQLDFQAECEGGYFSATTPVELLGLVAMWEIRGDNWKPKSGEGVILDELREASRTYDREGNLVLEK